MNTELSQRPSRRRGAFTMVELLVSMAISLVIVYALVEFMKQIGDTVTDGRAMIDLASQLRGVRQRLNEDLQSLTAQTRPWSDNGYFEYREGPLWDGDADGNGTADFARAAATDQYNIELQGGNTLFGDWDDVLAFTAHAGLEPFVGRHQGNAQQSQLAEVIWFAGFDDVDGDYEWDVNEPRFIYRRALLIRPDLPVYSGGMSSYSTYNDAMAAGQDELLQYWQDNDVSARVEVYQSGMNYSWQIRPNALADLSRRENRFAHQQGFPNLWNFHARRMREPAPGGAKYGLTYYVLGKYPLNNPPNGPRLGEDVMLSRVLAFDVQVFDPTVRIVSLTSDSTASALTPDSPSWVAGGQTEVGRGAFVDLGYLGFNPPRPNNNLPVVNNRPYAASARNWNGQLAYDPEEKSGFYISDMSGNKVLSERVWDTWSNTYEAGSQANDGIDNDNQNGVDDVGERATSPPYPVPIRGIRVTIRIYDPSTRQMRQGIVSAEFMPE